jgi:hypothetical protein
MTRTILGSLARISDLATVPYDVARLDRDRWATGDYVVAKVIGKKTELYQVEDCAGNMIPVQSGTFVVGALGERAATLEGVGSWRDVVDGRMHALTSAGLFGAFTSVSRFVPRPMSLDYFGHAVRDGEPVRMRDFAVTCDTGEYALPTVLLIGTSMSAGKTWTGKLVCRLLARANKRVIGAKLTGAGRYRDILSFRDAGAAEIYDFVDAGLPSTVVPEAEFRAAIRPLLRHVGSRNADFVVAEAGASPLEPYNGAAAIDELNGQVACTFLCASDPYAVVGVMQAFGCKPDAVTGPATNTSAAIDLVYQLTGLPGYNILDPAAEAGVRDFLFRRLGLL